MALVNLPESNKKLKTKAKAEPAVRFCALRDKVCREDRAPLS